MTHVFEHLNLALYLGHLGWVLVGVEIERSSVGGYLVALDELDGDLLAPLLVDASLTLPNSPSPNV